MILFSLCRFLNDSPIEPGLRFHVEQRPGYSDVAHSLSIETTQLEDTGTFRAVAENKAGKAMSEARLDVEGISF